jgi:hypothetical protein
VSRFPARAEKDPLSPWAKAILALIQALLPAMTAIIGGIWVAFTYIGHQHEIQSDAAEREKQQGETRLVEAQRPFLEKQLSLYFEAAQVAGKLSVFTPDDKEWSEAERRFWMLYWSELSMVESKDVEEAMVKFSKHLYD